jgi:hypothetical protein
MKQVFLFVILFVSVTSYSQNSKTLIYNENSIIAVTNNVESFDNLSRADITPYTLKHTESVTQYGLTYTVNVLRYKGWEDETGDYNVIDISSGSYKSQFTYDEGWDYFYCENEAVNTPNKSFYAVNLSSSCMALVFVGVSIASLPPFITVIVLRDRKAEIVYNKPAFMKDIQTAGKETRFILRLNTIEYDENNKPYEKEELATLSFGDGKIYYMKN